jgi:mRNA interferase RelE/StbE
MYQVLLTSKARKQLRNFDRPLRKRMDIVLLALSQNPRPNGVKKLTDVKPDTFRVRIGDYRIIYHILDDKLIVEVIEIGGRKDIYR